jgi:hypothetical protein
VSEWTCLLLAHLVVADVFLLPFRFVGFTVAAVAPTGARLDPNRFQFSLRSMLEWTTGASVVCSALCSLPYEFRRMFFAADWQIFILVSALDALLAALWLWVMLGSQWLRTRLLVLMLSATALLVMSSRGGDQIAFYRVPLALAHATWLLGTFFLVGLLGHRVRWCGMIL